MPSTAQRDVAMASGYLVRVLSQSIIVCLALQESPVVKVAPPKGPDLHEAEGRIAQWIDSETWQKLYK